ncbi:MAG: BON domain-containing protein [Pyrinomonadaceae bacterium]
MNFRLFVRAASMAAFVFVLLAFSNAAFGQKAQNSDCSATTDDQIVNAIYDAIQVKYSSEMDHVNVTSKDGVVTIRGYATTKKAKSAIEKAARKAKCVKSVTSHLAVGASGGCGPGYKVCGSTCIPENETCTIRTRG